MVTEQQAQDIVTREGERLKTMSFDELEGLALRQRTDINAGCQFQKVPDGEVFISTVVSKIGIVRRRITVEVTVTADGWKSWTSVPCVYFERSESGAIETFELRSLVDLLVKWAFPVSVVIGIVILLWQLLK